MGGTRVARRLLLLMLVLGIAGMHTLGHPEPGHGRHGMTMAGHSWDGPGAVSPQVEDPHAVRQAPAEKPPGLDPTTVCLAILTALALLVCAALAWYGWRPAAGRPGGLGRVPYVARPPPERTAVRLARLSVLRI